MHYKNSKFISFLMIIGLLAPLVVLGQQANTTLGDADSLFSIGQEKKACILYKKAAKAGSAEAHFALAYRYVLPQKEKLYHLTRAARKGHEEALDYALELLFFRSSSLTQTYPQKALNLYRQAKKANPNLELYDEKKKLKILKMSVVTSDFNGQKFIKKYDIKPDASAWMLAEKASRPGGRFGKSDPKLVLSLVVRGGFAPAEKMAAIESVYKDYKKGIVKPFDICDFITSGYGMGFCASRANKADKKKRLATLDSLKQVVNASAAPLIQQAYESAVQFIEAKASREEYHGGSGRATWIIQSEIKQKHVFLSLIDSVQHGFTPKPAQYFTAADRQLNITYQKALQVLSRAEQPFQYFTKAEDLRAVQRLWIHFRDAAAAAFYRMNAEVDLSMWKAWLTEQRIRQLQKIPGME